MDTPASKKFTLKLGTGFQHAKVTNSTGSRPLPPHADHSAVYIGCSRGTGKKIINQREKTNIYSKDITGNSQSADKWENPISRDCDYYPECDNTILWSDITYALRDTPNNKAPGSDGVPTEVWKLVITEQSPTSSLAKLIHKIINIMYDTGVIPTCLETSVVVPVPKKGDLKDPDNY
ncbi:hypothetical protein AYI70_g8260 [Smittium culicis]|uniref:Uncharacterized protein n=1 Tax=Smittium culicis TaxID=133412 RepID=A0A1R1XGU7_9FUNG|nr:hypothetical protein AYI70_g8260 [Smittium culicis]